jgi:hypothetical protein
MGSFFKNDLILVIMWLVYVRLSRIAAWGFLAALQT